MKTLITAIAVLVWAPLAHAIEFFDSVAERHFFDDALTIKTEKREDVIIYSISNAKNACGRSQVKIEGGWFIAPESPQKVWIYDGGKVLRLFEFTEKGMKFSDSSVRPDLATWAPQEVIDRINRRK